MLAGKKLKNMHNSATFIYPHQLFREHPAISKDRHIYIIEDPLYFSQYKFHKQKLVLHRASMKAYAQFLKESGHTVHYINHSDALSYSMKVSEVHVVDVVDDWLTKKIETYAQHVVWYESPQFITSDTDVRAYWQNHSKHLQYDFYVWQRKRLGILVDNNKPKGGTWSFDSVNRKSLPKHIHIPDSFQCVTNDYITEAIFYVETHFTDHYGTTAHFSYATTHHDAEKVLHLFLKEKLSSFGPYEDAITTSHHILFHSVLSPYLNIGLLTPHYVLKSVLDYGEKNNVPLASLEGFVRQLIGWREFMRMAYICGGVKMRNSNALSANRSLSKSWWTGNTGIYPVDHTIEILHKYAYTHHIVRLMIIGNIMTLLGVRPHDAYRWFMEWYIDAYDWAMVPNVYGMALYADGGTIVTKPYVSSSKYIQKMSDYSSGQWENTFDALYWHFIDKNKKVFLQIPRASLMVKMFEKFTKEKQHDIREKALKCISQLTDK